MVMASRPMPAQSKKICPLHSPTSTEQTGELARRCAFCSSTHQRAHEKTGKVKILAAAGVKRAQVRPELPTIAETLAAFARAASRFSCMNPAPTCERRGILTTCPVRVPIRRSTLDGGKSIHEPIASQYGS